MLPENALAVSELPLIGPSDPVRRCKIDSGTFTGPSLVPVSSTVLTPLLDESQEVKPTAMIAEMRRASFGFKYRICSFFWLTVLVYPPAYWKLWRG